MSELNECQLRHPMVFSSRCLLSPRTSASRRPCTAASTRRRPVARACGHVEPAKFGAIGRIVLHRAAKFAWARAPRGRSAGGEPWRCAVALLTCSMRHWMVSPSWSMSRLNVPLSFRAAQARGQSGIAPNCVGHACSSSLHQLSQLLPQPGAPPGPADWAVRLRARSCRWRAAPLSCGTPRCWRCRARGHRPGAAWRRRRGKRPSSNKARWIPCSPGTALSQ